MESVPNVENNSQRVDNSPLSTPHSPFLKSFKGDKVIWRIIIALSLVSLLVIYSSTSSLAYRAQSSTFMYFLKQFVFFVVSILIIYGAHLISIRWYRGLAKLVFFLSVGLLLLTFINGLGVTFNEGTRWVKLFGITFQPSEFTKFALILYVAKVVEENNLSSFKKYFWHILFPVGAVCILLIYRGSTSVALLLGFTVFIILFVAKIRSSYLWKTAGIAVAAIAMIVTVSYATKNMAYPLFPRVHKMVDKRIRPFISPDSEFQARQAIIAVASGGLIPKGPGNSTQRHILPNAYDDYVYAIIVEEYGIIGAITMLLLYLILLYRSVVIARSCTRAFAMVSVLGLMMLIVFQAMLHMGVTVGILPVTGQTLPFVSLGGSSLITTGGALGIILSISRATEEQVGSGSRQLQPAVAVGNKNNE
ncbi:MAG: FtsW/RodA/SpoVE family cell cycle protein [Prevotellaceae bacterium]|jgi:cell division protein FtsW|nr:FtsW/RodA/SpoVE family cell cycle protein [Prevotellaceae bacterium]